MMNEQIIMNEHGFRLWSLEWWWVVKIFRLHQVSYTVVAVGVVKPASARYMIVIALFSRKQHTNTHTSQ